MWVSSRAPNPHAVCGAELLPSTHPTSAHTDALNPSNTQRTLNRVRNPNVAEHRVTRDRLAAPWHLQLRQSPAGTSQLLFHVSVAAEHQHHEDAEVFAAAGCPEGCSLTWPWPVWFFCSPESFPTDPITLQQGEQGCGGCSPLHRRVWRVQQLMVPREGM